MSDQLWEPGKQVVVYSKDNCASCETLKRLLSLKAVDYEVKNISKDLDAMDFIAAKGHRSVPQVYMDGVHVPNPNTLTGELI